MTYKTKDGMYLQAIKIRQGGEGDINRFTNGEYSFNVIGSHVEVKVNGVNGTMVGNIGDYIVRTGDGNLSVVSEDLMNIMFELAPVQKKAMLSQPMRGLSDDEIVATRDRAIKYLESHGYEVVNTLFTDEWYSKGAMEERGVKQVPICFLAKSLDNMSRCDTVFFCNGWEGARGCRIEHQVAKAYGMQILYETTPSSTFYDIPYMKFSRDNWDEFVKFTDGMARNKQVEKRPGGSCTCIFLTNTGVFTVCEGDIIIRGNDGYLYHVAKSSSVPTRIAPKGDNDNE